MEGDKIVKTTKSGKLLDEEINISPVSDDRMGYYLGDTIMKLKLIKVRGKQSLVNVSEEDSLTIVYGITPLDEADLSFETVKWYLKGQYYFTKEEFSKAYPFYYKAAQSGNPIAQFALGDLYYFGKAVEKDQVTAFHWFRKSAYNWYMDGQHNLGGSYRYGSGVKKNLKTSIIWYKLAADQGFDASQYSLGEMYYRGEGVEKDYVKAKFYLQKAAEQGHPKAIGLLKKLN